MPTEHIFPDSAAKAADAQAHARAVAQAGVPAATEFETEKMSL